MTIPANRLPVRDDIKTISYYRKPTPAEVCFGEGARHYRDFAVKEACWPETRILKRWFVNDGYRWFRSAWR